MNRVLNPLHLSLTTSHDLLVLADNLPLVWTTFKVAATSFLCHTPFLGLLATPKARRSLTRIYKDRRKAHLIFFINLDPLLGYSPCQSGNWVLTFSYLLKISLTMSIYLLDSYWANMHVILSTNPAHFTLTCQPNQGLLLVQGFDWPTPTFWLSWGSHLVNK